MKIIILRPFNKTTDDQIIIFFLPTLLIFN